MTRRKGVATSASQRRAKSPAALPGPPPDPARFFIVGLGASAGGLEALEDFFSHLPADTGMAFVVVTHQHPGHVSLLPELLKKRAPIPVVEADDALCLAPNRIYVASPDGYLSILSGTLQVMPFKEIAGLRLPIDYFFRALAEDQKERAVGIVLSGTGTDGTLGLKAIKGAMGMTMAQAPETAKYSGMPQSAMGTGVVDYVLPPGRMPEQLMTYVKGP